MPFLFPALAAGICDVGILYLGRRNYLLEQEFHSDLISGDGLIVYNDDDDTSRRVYHYGYIVWLAAIRLFLLLVPLPYHSFFGKALRCQFLYRLFYGLTLLLLGVHALALIMIDPQSLASLIRAIASNEGNVHHILVTRSLWVAMILTLVSCLNHIALFFHVRSTAPTDAEFFVGGRRRPKVLLYYAKEKKQSEEEHSERDGLLSSVVMNGDDSDPLIIGLPVESNQSMRRTASMSSIRAFQEFSKVMSEVQKRLRTAKTEWTIRLEEYQKPIKAKAAAAGIESSKPSSSLAPFRVILELFAGDNNFNLQSNDHTGIDRLNAVYDLDDGAALMLFVPQLLSFLLHGAYESSHQLEEWILETCRKNLFFAHKCYWFLRAWSLEATNSALEETPEQQQQQSQSQMVSRLSHSSSLQSFATQEDEANHRVSKLMPEERAVIEELMRKIMKCGEEPARLLHFGTLEGNQAIEASPPRNVVSRSLFSHEHSGSTVSSRSFPHVSSSLTPESAINLQLIPSNPLTGTPSMKHYECLTASRRYGFLPLDNGLRLSARYETSVLHGDPCGTSYFDSTPVFMDALVTIADNLFRVPRDERRTEFKKKLQLLEVEALPCNEIYIPLQNIHHRVWRIVEEESIDISTKERVPCIVCLEVVDYTQENPADRDRDIGKLLKMRSERSTTKETAALSERELVEKWRNTPRNPYRRETAFQRMTQGMGKIPDKMKESMQEMQVSMQEMQEQIRQGVSRIRQPGEYIGDSDFSAVTESFESLHSEFAPSKAEMHRGDIERCDTTTDALSSPTKGPQTEHSSPRSPRQTIEQGAMGQWTKSPKPKAPSKALEFSDEAVEDLSAPALKNYNTVSNSSSNMSHRRSSRYTNGNGAAKLSLRVDQCDTEWNSTHGEDDEENGYNDNSYSNPVGKPPTPKQRTSRAPPVVFKENWKEKEERIRASSAYGNHPGWRLLPVLIKSNDDLRQEQLASQLIQRMALILARDQVSVWLCPNEILALEKNGGIIEAIPDTISLSALKKNDPDYTDLKGFFEQYFCDPESLAGAKANFCESLAAYSIVCFLLQIKDRHNGNILLDNQGHIIHIDFGFFFLSSPGKNTGFESAPFKLTREFVSVLGGPDSHLFGIFRTLCYRTFISLRKHCHEIILLVEMLQLGNEDLACFRGRPNDAIHELRQRFRLDLNDRACLEYVNALIDESLENWRTNWYDRYQRYCVGVL